MLTRTHLTEAMKSLVSEPIKYNEIVWDIIEFNSIFEVNPNPALYVDLLIEESSEFMEEVMLHGATENLLKELADTLYILEGLIGMCPDEELPEEIDQEKLFKSIAIIKEGIAPISEFFFSPDTVIAAFKEVHRSNLSKLDEDGSVLRREDGKVLKGPNYSEADLSGLWNQKVVTENYMRLLKG